MIGSKQGQMSDWLASFGISVLNLTAERVLLDRNKDRESLEKVGKGIGRQKIALKMMEEVYIP